MNRYIKVKSHKRLFWDNKKQVIKHKKIKIKKSRIILVSLLIASSVIVYQGYKLNSEIKPQEALQATKVSKTVNPTKEEKKTTTAKPIDNKDNIQTTYEVIGVTLNDSQKKVANKIIQIAEKKDFRWIPYLVELSWCESRLGETQINDKNNKPAGSKDRGVFQINNYWHPDITDKQAFDLEWSTNWTMNMINKGYQSRWMCDDIIIHNDIKIKLDKIK